MLAGFPAAVGTLWESDSTHAHHGTRDFYGRAVGGSGQGPALVLHHSVRALRERIPERPHIWAAYPRGRVSARGRSGRDPEGGQGSIRPARMA
ncbi:hypothetical protein ACF05L_19885 [Streptomyces bobili]|uniref:hypothetical protein n=1 Tax=Streptomyces bobili TaxID=67280 RepID=UPI00370110D0